jgi:hypothetical protein
MVPEGARRFPLRRRRRVVLPAPLAPIRRVRERGGRSRDTEVRPRERSGKVYVRFSTWMLGARDWSGIGSDEAIVGGGGELEGVVVWSSEEGERKKRLRES